LKWDYCLPAPVRDARVAHRAAFPYAVPASVTLSPQLQVEQNA
jgi:hypothetical protein